MLRPRAVERAGGFLLPDDRGAELRVALFRDRGGEDARVAMGVTLSQTRVRAQSPRR